MRKIIIWPIISTLLTGIFFLQRGFSFDKLSTAYIQKTGAYPYIVLAMCILLLYLKRDKILAGMQEGTNTPMAIIGLSLAGLSMILAFDEPSFQIFGLMLLWLGIFTFLFPKAASIPLFLLGIYGFALVFPPIVSRSGNFFPMATTAVLILIMGPFLPISHQGTTIRFLDISGGYQTYLIDAGCSGSASLAIFLSLFFLMLLDKPMPWKKAGYLFIFGLAGTSLQNILRLIVLVLEGYWHGSEGLWSAHTYAGYILFPVWYSLFAYVYYKQASNPDVSPLSP